jgi:hypothetical protein
MMLVRKLQINEFEEIRNDAYENSRIHKARIKEFLDKKILRKILMLVKMSCFIILDYIYFLKN